MTAQADYRGIEGVEGVEPVGAVLTIGHKGERGNPTDTDRFFLVVPTMGSDQRRAEHPEFATFNRAKTEHRQTIHGNLVHASEADCWDYHLKAQVLPNPWKAHPDKRPSCIGDGTNATRFYGETGPDDFRGMECPNELCEFRQGSGAKPCKPFGRLYFRLRWKTDALPSPLVKWTTGSWNSVRAVMGFFEHVREQAEGLGLAGYSLYGLPFSLTLSRKTKPSAKAAFPVVSISPECDLIAFFLQQRQQLRELGATERKLIAVGARNPEEQAVEEVFADHATITPGHVRKPASVVEAAEPEDEPETVDAEVERAEEPSLDERYNRLQAQARGLGLTDSDLQDAIGAVGGTFPDLLPEQDADVIRTLQERARKAKR